MPIQSKNPFNGEVLKTFTEWTPSETTAAITRAAEAYDSWRKVSVGERAALLAKAAELMRAQAPELARLATLEMGKLYREALNWEVPICADIADYYAQHGESILAPQPIPVADGHAEILSEPTGVLLGVMPWNFPYYQVLRFVAPNLVAGNVCLVKHASNVPQCAQALEEIFRRAGFPEGVYTNLCISARQVQSVVEHPLVRGISLTGSEAAGRKVAEQAGNALKKAVMELGGNDPMIILDDADVDQAAQVAFEGKMFNSGQCCAAAKRFILQRGIAREFLARFEAKLKALQPGNPLAETTGYAPLVSEDAANEIVSQVQQSVALGAKVLLGGKRAAVAGAFVEPTILVDIPREAPAYAQEIFGPVASVFIVDSEAEAIALANDTVFGLGSAICTTSPKRAARVAAKLEAGMVYVNTYTISRPELPFGGVKNSGFGRELSTLGIQEFLNKKLVRWAADKSN